MLYKVGITGNICTGKTACLKFLSTLPYVQTLNYDLIAHRIYETNSKFHHILKENFKEDVHKIYTNEGTADEKFNRKELGKIVFNDKEKLLRLNRLIQPELFIEMKRQIARIENNLKSKCLLFVEGAIIIESGHFKLFNELWLTIAREDEILKRFHQRNPRMSRDEARRLLERIRQFQMSSEEKRDYCSRVIDTSQSMEITEGICIKLYKQLIKERLKLDL